jgi:hypothetical protein
LADAVFIKRTLTARRGKKRTKLILSVYKPVTHDRHVSCKTELRAGDRLLWPTRLEFSGMAGIDDLQAFVLAMRMAACELLRFELDSGMRVDAWEWMDLIDFVGEAPISPDALARVAEIKKSLREALQEYREREDLSPQSRVATASRKPRAAAVRRNRNRNRSRSRSRK